MDDLIACRLDLPPFLLVVNAWNILPDSAWIAEQRNSGDAIAVDASSCCARIALQGCEAVSVLQSLTGVDLAGMKCC